MAVKLWVICLLTGFTASANIGILSTPADTIPPTERYFTSFGYTTALPRYSILNSVIANYNQTRPNIAKPMRRITNMHGFALSLGTFGKGYIIEYSYGQVNGRTVGIDSVQGYEETTGLRIRNHFASMGVVAKIAKHKRFTFYAGGAVTVGFEKISTGIFRSIDVYKPPPLPLQTNLLLGFTVAPQVHFALDKTGRLGFLAKPYVYFQFLEAFYGDLNKKINPKTFQNYDNNNLYGLPYILGLELKFYVIL